MGKYISRACYVITRKDRLNRHGGGVALYNKENMSFSVRHDLAPARLEIICLEINLPYNRSFLVSKSFLVSTRYRPPSANINLFEDNAKFLQKCDKTNKQLIVLGDMNVTILKIHLNHTLINFNSYHLYINYNN